MFATLQHYVHNNRDSRGLQISSGLKPADDSVTNITHETVQTRPCHQTEIVNGAHSGPVYPTPAPCPSIDASQKDSKYSYNAFQMTSQKSI